MLKIKAVIITDKKHHILVNSSPPPSEINSPPHKRERKTRTVNLHGQNQTKAQFYTPYQRYHKKILWWGRAAAKQKKTADR